MIRALGLAVATGALAWLAHPPVGAGPVAFVVVPLFLAAVAVGTDPSRRLWPDVMAAAVVGFVAGMALFLPMFPWLVPAAGYVAWILLAAVQAGWFALLAVLVRGWLRSVWIIAVAPLLWTGVEVWRGTIPWGGFPWGELGYAHANTAWMLPVARIVGVHGLTGLTALVGAAVYWLARRAAVDRPTGRRGRPAPVVTAVAILTLALVAPPLLAPEAPQPTGREVDVLAVQGNNLEDFEGGAATEDVAVARRMLAETRASVAAEGRPDLTVWPESSIDRDPFTTTGRDLLPYVRRGADMVGGGLLFGVNLDGPRPRETFVNASLLVDDELNVIDRYRKRHYVPFGEYVPLRGLLGGLPPLRQIPRDGVPADGPQTVTGGAVRTAVVICYETLFPDIVRTNVTTGDAGLLVAVTNDASFGRSWQSSQHIAQSRLRAVETGRWVVHAALSGGSAIIRPDGRIVEGTELFERTTMRKHLPVVTADTAYLDLGGWIDTAVRWSSAGVALIAAATVISRGRASSRRRSSRQRSQLPHEERS